MRRDTAVRFLRYVKNEIINPQNGADHRMAALFWRGLYESCLLSAPESCFAQRNAEYKSQRNFDAVRNDKGNRPPDGGADREAFRGKDF